MDVMKSADLNPNASIKKTSIDEIAVLEVDEFHQFVARNCLFSQYYSLFLFGIIETFVGIS